MKACGEWVLVQSEHTKTKSGLTISDLNIGTIISGKGDGFDIGDRVYFNKRNAINIEEYLLIVKNDIYVVID